MFPNLGYQGKLYILGNTASNPTAVGTRATWSSTQLADGFFTGPAPSNLSEIDLVGDIEGDDQDNVAEINVRRTQGFTAAMNGRTTFKIPITVLWIPTDPCVLLLEGAKASRTTVPLLFLDQAYTAAGARGVWADFAVFSRKVTQKNGDPQTVGYDVQIGYSNVAPQYVICTGGSGSGVVTE